MIIDAHTHIGKLANTLYSENYEKNLDLILKEAGENGVEKLIIIAGLGKKDVDPSTEQLLELIKDRQNIYAVAGIDLFNLWVEDLKTLTRYLDNRMIVGLKLYTGYQHFYPEDERCKPIYDLALTYDVPVIFHSGDTLAGIVKNPKVKYAHPLHIDDIAADYPKLKIIIAHMGNPWLIDCAEVLYKNPNVYADLSGLFIEEILQTSYGEMMRKRIIELAAYIGSDHKLLYGTDWPLCRMKPYIEFVKNLGFDEKGMEDLFSANAQKMFKI